MTETQIYKGERERDCHQLALPVASQKSSQRRRMEDQQSPWRTKVQCRKQVCEEEGKGRPGSHHQQILHPRDPTFHQGPPWKQELGQQTARGGDNVV